jgi:5-methylcytosine-specific restriction endonuclease McrA
MTRATIEATSQTRKRCPKCEVTKARSAFGDRRAGSGSIVPRSRCRDCERVESSRRYHRDREKLGIAHAEARRLDPERFREYDRRARTKHATRRQQTRRDHYADHREDARAASRAWAKANPERRRANQRAYVARLPIGTRRERAAEAARKRRAQERHAIPFSLTDLEARLSMWPDCWLCGGVATEVDHVKPLARGGLHALCNLRPICRSCNARKGDTWPVCTGGAGKSLGDHASTQVAVAVARNVYGFSDAGRVSGEAR